MYITTQDESFKDFNFVFIRCVINSFHFFLCISISVCCQKGLSSFTSGPFLFVCWGWYLLVRQIWKWKLTSHICSFFSNGHFFGLFQFAQKTRLQQNGSNHIIAVHFYFTHCFLFFVHSDQFLFQISHLRLILRWRAVTTMVKRAWLRSKNSSWWCSSPSWTLPLPPFDLLPLITLHILGKTMLKAQRPIPPFSITCPLRKTKENAEPILQCQLKSLLTL